MFRYFFITSFLFFLSIALFLLTYFFFDPFGPQKIFAFVAMFSAIFFSVATFFTFFFFFAAEIFSKKKLSKKNFFIAARRGIFSGFFAIFCAALQIFQFLDFLEIFLFLIFLLIIEIIFIFSKK